MKAAAWIGLFKDNFQWRTREFRDWSMDPNNNHSRVCQTFGRSWTSDVVKVKNAVNYTTRCSVSNEIILNLRSVYVIQGNKMNLHYKADTLMMCTYIITPFCKSQKKYINTPYGSNRKLLSVKAICSLHAVNLYYNR